MKIECTVDGKHCLFTVNSNKPLNLILMEEMEIPAMNSHCRDGNCGNCVVLLNDEAVLACLTPAFRLKDARILTFEGYQKTRFWHDIERAFEDTKSHPCPYCFASKTLILESLLQTLGKSETGGGPGENSPDDATIISEMGLNTCNCLDAHELVEIFNTAAAYRRRRRVRRN
ncbi:MAG: (2Fe-2S)-binding protein [Sphaerochaetaceae bacterium]